MNTPVRITEVETCGDWYCNGHGIRQSVIGERTTEGNYIVLGKHFGSAESVFNASVRDIVKVEVLDSEGKERVTKRGVK